MPKPRLDMRCHIPVDGTTVNVSKNSITIRTQIPVGCENIMHDVKLTVAMSEELVEELKGIRAKTRPTSEDRTQAIIDLVGVEL